MSHPGTPPSYYQADNYRPEDSIGLMMRQILTSLAQGVEQRLVNSALTHAQWMPVLKLHLGHATTVAELARECHLDAGAMTRMLDRLEAKGLCTRSRSETDRRVVNIASDTALWGAPRLMAYVASKGAVMLSNSGRMSNVRKASLSHTSFHCQKAQSTSA
jgi:NAD(P)-dependent dehydrogenase (short-subunit alcohol dehydrogenase family)